MDVEQFKKFGKAAIDYIADYIENIRDKPVLSSVKPGYMDNLLPKEAPLFSETWQDVLSDVDRIIIPGLTHWQSPNFHSYYPSLTSYPAIVAEIISAGLNTIGLSWLSSPANTELEVAMVNWLGKMLNLPEVFLNCSSGPGGGVIQSSASESTFLALLAAKERKVKELIDSEYKISNEEISLGLVAYTSDQANSCVEKASKLGSITIRILPADEKGKLRGDVLLNAIRKDKEKGLIPCYVCATLGTTATCAFDDLKELGLICNTENVWLHVDAAYAGTAFACPEYQHLMKGVELVDSFNFSPHKWMMVNYDCSVLWVKNSKYIVDTLNVERIYLEDKNEGNAPEYRHWQIPIGRRFRALKLWFVLRLYGVEGIRKHVRNHVALAKYFESLVHKDNRFNVCTVSMGLVCFRLVGKDELTIKLLNNVTERKNIFIMAGYFNKKVCIRFVISSNNSRIEDMNYAWNEILLSLKDVYHEKKENFKSDSLISLRKLPRRARVQSSVKKY